MIPPIEIDSNSGFCFGVVTAIRKAEEELAFSGRLYCLGDIVHNSDEVERLRAKGLITITHEQMEQLRDVKVLLRAHGEPPSTYELARRNNIEIIDATCPVVLQLQRRIKASHCTPDPTSATGEHKPQIVIYGKIGHAEVNGLVGQTDGEAIVMESEDDINKMDLSRDTILYSQTTKSLEGFSAIRRAIAQRINPSASFVSYDTICRQVANRVQQLSQFAASHDLILFVSGLKSSNGRILYDHCRRMNPSTRFITNASEIDPEWLRDVESVGICGATSTPRWLMEEVRDKTIEICKSF